MTHRISSNGSFRIDRCFKKVGRIAIASGTKDRQTFGKLNTMLTELYEDGYLDVLRGIRDHRWPLQEVYQARRTGRISYIESELILTRDLWDVVQDWELQSAPSEGTRKRYAVSFSALKRSGVLDCAFR